MIRNRHRTVKLSVAGPSLAACCPASGGPVASAGWRHLLNPGASLEDDVFACAHALWSPPIEAYNASNPTVRCSADLCQHADAGTGPRSLRRHAVSEHILLSHWVHPAPLSTSSTLHNASRAGHSPAGPQQLSNARASPAGVVALRLRKHGGNARTAKLAQRVARWRQVKEQGAGEHQRHT
jgi:hypothetical protein